MITLYEDTPCANLIALVERCAPKFMRIGGGSLSQSIHFRPPGSVTEEAKARVIEMAEAGATMRAIQQETGVSVGYAWKLARKAGVI